MGKRSKRTLRKEMRRLNQSVQHLASEIVLWEVALYNLNRRLSKLAYEHVHQQSASLSASATATADTSEPDNAGWTTTWTYPSRS